MRSSPDLPPLASLRAFVETARHLSFRKAGEALLISQSAVSHHVAKLEAMLGERLFVRKARSIALTEVGAAYYEEMARVFRDIEAATRAARSHGGTQLRVSVLPSFAGNWLAPRLERWRAEQDVEIALDPTLRRVDVAAGEADIAVRYGWGDWPGAAPRLLREERIAIIASPALLEKGPPLDAPRDVLDHTLLMNMRPYDWEAWASTASVDLAGARVLQLTDYNIVIQAALDGLGLAAGRLLLVGDRLRSGALLQARPEIGAAPGLGYWAILSPAAATRPEALAFVDWLEREMNAAA